MHYGKHNNGRFVILQTNLINQLFDNLILFDNYDT